MLSNFESDQGFSVFNNNSKFTLSNTVKFGYSYKYLEKKKNSLIKMNKSKNGQSSNSSLNLSGMLDLSEMRF